MTYAELTRDDREDLYAFMCRQLSWTDLSLRARAWLRERMPEAAPAERKNKRGRAGWWRR